MTGTPVRLVAALSGRYGIRGMSPVLLAVTPAFEMTPTVFPDGKWLAYAANDGGGAPQVYLSPFPNVSDRRIPVSVRGGTQPRWSANNDLFYISLMIRVLGDVPMVRVDNRLADFPGLAR